MDNPSPVTVENTHDTSDAGTLDAAIQAEMAALERTTGKGQDEQGTKQQKQQQPQDGAEGQGTQEPDDAPGDDDPGQADPDNPDGDQADDNAEGDEAEVEGEYIEFEHEGAKFKVPKELESALLMRADYSRKTEELAQQRAQVESDRARVKALFDQSGPYIQARAEQEWHRAEHTRLMNTTNWAQLEATDITEFNRLTGKIALHSQRIGQLDQVMQSTQAELERAEAEEAQARVQEATEQMKRIWPTFTGQDAARLGAFARHCGVKPETIRYLDSGHDPVAMRLLDFAFSHVMAIRNKPAALQKVANAKQALPVGSANAGQNRGAQNVTKFASRLKTSGGIHDAVALELAVEQRRASRRGRR